MSYWSNRTDCCIQLSKDKWFEGLEDAETLHDCVVNTRFTRKEMYTCMCLTAFHCGKVQTFASFIEISGKALFDVV